MRKQGARWQKIVGPSEVEEGVGPLHEHLKRLDKELGCAVHLIGLAGRQGIGSFLSAFEETFFPYGTDANEFYQIALVEWEQAGWYVVSFPVSYLDVALEMMHKSGLTAVSGYPTIIEDRRVSHFPVGNVERVYHIELYNPEGGPVLSMMFYPPPLGDDPTGYG